MKKQFFEEQITGFLREAGKGLSDREAAPEHAVLPVLQGPPRGRCGRE